MDRRWLRRRVDLATGAGVSDVIERTQTLLRLRGQAPGTSGRVRFDDGVRGHEPSKVLDVSPAYVHELGNPTELTVTIEAGDLLND